MLVWLEEPTFTHRQLYVAASRIAIPQHLHFAVNNSVSRKTRNVVYEEILLTVVVVCTPTWLQLACSLQNSDNPMGAIEECRCMASMHFLDFDRISVTTRRM